MIHKKLQRQKLSEEFGKAMRKNNCSTSKIIWQTIWCVRRVIGSLPILSTVQVVTYWPWLETLSRGGRKTWRVSINTPTHIMLIKSETSEVKVKSHKAVKKLLRSKALRVNKVCPKHLKSLGLCGAILNDMPQWHCVVPLNWDTGMWAG